MIKHIVLWKFQEGTEKEQETFLEGLRGLMGIIPEIREQEVGRNCTLGNYDAALISVFDNLEALERYKNDPRHRAVAEICARIRIDRVAVDMELPDGC